MRVGWGLEPTKFSKKKNPQGILSKAFILGPEGNKSALWRGVGVPAVLGDGFPWSDPGIAAGAELGDTHVERDTFNRVLNKGAFFWHPKLSLTNKSCVRQAAGQGWRVYSAILSVPGNERNLFFLLDFLSPALLDGLLVPFFPTVFGAGGCRVEQDINPCTPTSLYLHQGGRQN